MASEVLRHWAPDWKTRWPVPSTETSPIAFHAGQMLFEGGVLWLSLHSLEPEILRRLDRSTVPVAHFGSSEGVAAYIRVAEESAAALGSALAVEVRWVHPIPRGAGAPAEMARLGAGAGFDLDSYLTVLPGRRALVASLEEGAKSLQRAPTADFDHLATFYELSVRGDALRARLVETAGPGATSLEAYLDGIARHLGELGIDVSRTPLVRVPTRLFRDRQGVDYDEFFLTWNNLVLEPSGSGFRVEGFEMAFPSADRAVEALLTEKGFIWTRLPPLRRSIVLGGGYRCASNHLRLLPTPPD